MNLNYERNRIYNNLYVLNIGSINFCNCYILSNGCTRMLDHFCMNWKFYSHNLIVYLGYVNLMFGLMNVKTVFWAVIFVLWLIRWWWAVMDRRGGTESHSQMIVKRGIGTVFDPMLDLDCCVLLTVRINVILTVKHWGWGWVNLKSCTNLCHRMFLIHELYLLPCPLLGR